MHADVDVGGNRMPPMVALRSTLEWARFQCVRSCIQSGNVVLVGVITAHARRHA
ncbi:MAG: DUF1697 domain-containing protein [Steroidobacteraceae bacterium]